MNRLYKTLSILGLCTLPFLVSSCEKSEPINLKVKVVSENYRKGLNLWFTPNAVDYSFVGDTEYGRKIIKVLSDESKVEKLIEPNMEIEIKSVYKRSLDETVIEVWGNQIL